jgi:hypothetical protein
MATFTVDETVIAAAEAEKAWETYVLFPRQTHRGRVVGSRFNVEVEFVFSEGPLGSMLQVAGRFTVVAFVGMRAGFFRDDGTMYMVVRMRWMSAVAVGVTRAYTWRLESLRVMGGSGAIPGP